jgi:hypothetical protein
VAERLRLLFRHPVVAAALHHLLAGHGDLHVEDLALLLLRELLLAAVLEVLDLVVRIASVIDESISSLAAALTSGSLSTTVATSESRAVV